MGQEPHEQRVLGTYVFIEAALRLMADQGAALRTATEQDKALRPAKILANFEQEDAPSSTRMFKGIRYDMVEGKVEAVSGEGGSVRMVLQPASRPQ